jgi:hypothetical protein
VLSSAQDMPNCGAQGASAVWPSDAGVRRPAAAGAPALQPLGTAFRGAQVTRKALLLSGLPMQGYEGQAAGWARKTELVTSFTSAAITARPGASRPPQTRRHGGRRAKRQQQARALAPTSLLHRRQGGGRPPQLVGRQVEKVRQCRTALVSLPSAQPHPSLMR